MLVERSACDERTRRPSGYPLQFEGRSPPPEPLAVAGQVDPRDPALIVLAAPLWIALVVLTVVAFFAILFTGRYPRAIFDFNVGVLRWTWRVGFYSYSALGDRPLPAVHARRRAGLPGATRRRIPGDALARPGPREVVAARAAAVPHRRSVRRGRLGRLQRRQRPRGMDVRRRPHRPAGPASRASCCCSPGATPRPSSTS